MSSMSTICLMILSTNLGSGLNSWTTFDPTMSQPLGSCVRSSELTAHSLKRFRVRT